MVGNKQLIREIRYSSQRLLKTTHQKIRSYFVAAMSLRADQKANFFSQPHLQDTTLDPVKPKKLTSSPYLTLDTRMAY
ncbi:hypothetical protein D3C85_1753000 [compost metagenome]